MVDRTDRSNSDRRDLALGCAPEPQPRGAALSASPSSTAAPPSSSAPRLWSPLPDDHPAMLAAGPAPVLSGAQRPFRGGGNRGPIRAHTRQTTSVGAIFQHSGANFSVAPRPGAGGAHRQDIYAAIDLGTNNCRLLVARPRSSGFSVIDAYSRTVCLGENLGVTGELDPVAMGRAVDALRVCVSKMERRGVTVARSIATQACRSARNGKPFLDRIRRETGLVFDIIPPAEEAWLAAMGCWPLVDRDCSTALVFDIGGGSTELIWIDLRGPHARKSHPTILSWTSLPYGVVNLRERFGTPHLEPDAYAAMVGEVRGTLETFTGADRCRRDFGTERVHLIGTSGTVTTLAGLMMGLPRYDRDRIDGVWLDMPKVRTLIGDLASRTTPQRAELPCIGSDRADFILAGCAILDAIDSLWPTPRLRVADRGLREGILLSLMVKSGQRTRSRRPGHRGKV